jgi:hypothetical protein
MICMVTYALVNPTHRSEAGLLTAECFTGLTDAKSKPDALRNFPGFQVITLSSLRHPYLTWALAAQIPRPAHCQKPMRARKTGQTYTWNCQHCPYTHPAQL